MKRISWIMICMVMFGLAGTLYADDIDDSLPANTSQQIKASTRSMIQAGINKDEVVGMTQAMIHNRITDQNIMRAHRSIMNAHQADLPVEPLISKAYEGISKKVNGTNIVSAMEKIRARYAYAYAKAQQITTQKTQIAKTGGLLAQSMAAGLTKKDADAIMDRVQSRSRGLDQNQASDLCDKTLQLTRDMMRLGASSGTSAQMVGQALQNGYTAMEMSQLQSKFMHQSRFKSPEEIANQYQSQIQQGTKPDNMGGPGAGSGSGPGSDSSAGPGASGSGGSAGSGGASDGSSSGGSSGSGGTGGAGGGGSGSGAGGAGSGSGGGSGTGK